MLRKFLMATATTAMLAGAAMAQDATSDIVDTAVAAGDFTTLVAAVQAAGLVDTLKGEGPFTVFAPTNAAFAALPAGTVDTLLKPENKGTLTAVLTYHVVPGRLDAKTLAAKVKAGKGSAALTTVQGETLTVRSADGGVTVTDAKGNVATVTIADVQQKNGVIHVIDKVLLPADKTLVQTVLATPALSILGEAVVAAGLVDTLNGAGPFTVFAPTNDAFAALLTELGVTKEQLLADKPLLTQVLTYHVLAGRVLKADVPVNTPITTVQGGTFTVSPALRITDQRGRSAGIAATDVLATNGVAHVIDKVILPAP